ncbi:MAG: YdcF family protein [Opitutales bacterium]|nr:YdcF family protein [Opitutales bacterium]
MKTVFRWWRRTAWALVFVALAALGGVFAINAWMILSTNKRIFSDVDELAPKEWGLVLGTSPASPYFMPRIEAGAELFHRGKVRRLIVSGTGGDPYYDEAVAMRDALAARGVPAAVIVLDAAGWRTFDSVWRARDVYGAHDVIFVSQRFHQHRALFLARRHGLDATAYVAGDIPEGRRWPVRMREWGARVLAVVDVHAGRAEGRAP